MPLFKPDLDGLVRKKNVDKICEIAINAFKTGDTDTCFDAVWSLALFNNPRSNAVLLEFAEKWWKLPTGKKHHGEEIKDISMRALSESGDANIIQPLASILYRTWESEFPKDLGYLSKLVLSVNEEAEEPLLYFLNIQYKTLQGSHSSSELYDKLMMLLALVGGERSIEFLNGFIGGPPSPYPNPAIAALAVIKKRINK